jgi:hypothetical protein
MGNVPCLPRFIGGKMKGRAPVADLWDPDGSSEPFGCGCYILLDQFLQLDLPAAVVVLARCMGPSLGVPASPGTPLPQDDKQRRGLRGSFAGRGVAAAGAVPTGLGSILWGLPRTYVRG